MEMPALEIILFVIAAGFIGAFVDSVVGGGGLITLPALMLTGLPPNLVLGTNKLGGTLASLTSSTTFLLSGKIDKKTVAYLFPLSFLGAVLGAYTVQLIPPDFLRPLVVCMLVVILIYTLLKKNLHGAGAARAKRTWRSGAIVGLIALVIGFYDGFFGPGTGSFLLFMFLLLGFDFVGASGNARVLNFGSNISSLLTFIYFQSVHFGYGLFLGPAMIAGAVTGSLFAIRRGSAFVKPLFIMVTSLLIGKQLWDLLGG